LADFFAVLYCARFALPATFPLAKEGKVVASLLIVLPETFNAATYFVDRHVPEGRGERIAIECGDEKVSYRQLFERSNRVGNALRKLDVRLEERVLLLLSDTPEFLYCFFGAIKIGAVPVPVNTWIRPCDYEQLLNDCRARVAIVSAEFLPQLEQIPAERLRYLLEVIVVGENAPEYLELNELMDAASPELEAEPTNKDDAAFWLYSSGSTGASKGCVHLQHDMVVCSELYAKGILRINEHDRCYSVARLFFAYGLGNTGYFPLSVGATTILSPARPTPQSIYADIERYRPTLFFSVPSNYLALLACQCEGGGDFDLSSIRHAVSAGEGLPASIFERFKARFGVEILDALGSTEMLHVVIANRPGEARAGSSGKIIPGYEARIVDEQGRDVVPNVIGDLLIKGDSSCIGYWNRHEKSKDTFAGHWFHTGDKYYRDEDGYYWHAGRSDDLFKVNGRWLSPAEVEGVLIAHAAVREAAVVSRADESGLIKPVAFVVTNSQFSANEQLAQELQEWVAKALGWYKSPRWIEFLQEIPKTATGKLQRFKLRELEAQKPRSTRPV
jgi:benzoate-CoA ligase family protein